MAEHGPAELTALLAADTTRARDRAWARFVSTYSRLLFHSARSLGGDHDATMDGYAAILDALRADDCQRLRAFIPDGRTRFTTWLVVIARRIAVDHHRTRYGRPSERADRQITDAALVRRRLADLLAAPLGEDDAVAPATDEPDHALRLAQQRDALAAALATLAPKDRLLLALRFIQGLSARDIAEQLEFPSVFHVYRRVEALRAELRRRLLGLGVEDAAP